ncbi:HTTM domain-containing protein [Natrialba hulunbeirensis JCM 10989]|uniref:HTTM domain-containing protein n=1 Tax=Natrialba hulunbeirensis JCM 10989 TaxID=1227493 RepID=M0A3K6_9EURY|nr:HTTM domain-containing protein [Natrialba hulunbeirensis]ELY93350.1 HTTM domain-containing protein [Natrialba hulunbeirensis JCM 10989]
MVAAPDSWTDALESRLGIDLRALAAFRIGLGLVLLIDLLTLRLPGLRTFYTDQGVFPRETLAETYPLFEALSVHALSGAAWFQALLLALAGLFAASLLVGYRTRLATVGALVLTASLYARNPLALNGGDTILLTFLALGLFLPLSARWSVDARRHANESTSQKPTALDSRTCSLATAAILVHFTLIYVTNAILKFQSDAWLGGFAVQRTLHLEQYLTPLGAALSDLSLVLIAVNWFWVALLSSSVVLLVVTGRLRLALVAGFVGTHLGMAATMRLGVFPLVMILGLLLFVPSPVWRQLEPVVETRTPDRLVAGRPVRGDGGTAGRGADDVASTSSESSQGWWPTLNASRGVRVLSGVLVACLFAILLFWHAAAVGVGGPAAVTDVDEDLGSWSFFAPNPPDAYSWYAIDATLESGETVETHVDGTAVRADRPPDGTAAYPSTLWKRYGMDVRYVGDVYYEPLAAFSCEQVGEQSDQPVDSVTVVHVEQPVGPDGPLGEPDRQERIESAC